MGRQHQGFRLLSVFNTKWFEVQKSPPILNADKSWWGLDEDNGTVRTNGNRIKTFIKTYPAV